jgi:glucose/arabinose dehydrogenase/cytochrome c2
MRIRPSALILALAAYGTSTFAADANAGKDVFRGQCALCHSAEPNDNGGAQGPDLNGVLGRHAAAGGSFGYTEALKKANLTWDAPTLDRFLTSPTTVVPGSAMVIPVPKKEDRENLIAYFQALKDGTFKEAPPRGFGPPPGPPPAAAAPPKGEADWKKDAPGRVHKVDVAKLPAPYDTPAARNFPRFIDKPAGASLSVPAGFKVDTFATGLQGPRNMRLAPNGDIFLAETFSGRVKVLRPTSDNTKAESVEVFAQGLALPFGIAFYPANAPKWLYVAEVNRVVRYAYQSGAMKATAVPEVVIPQLAPFGGGGHFTRDIAFSLDGKRMFVSVGSASNVAEDIAKKPLADAKAWDAQHGTTGAMWGNEENRAAVMVYEVGTDKPGKVFATGIRNCVGLTMQSTGDLWCTVNERDLLGDDLVPDYSSRIREGGFYGWPWYYMGKYEDPRLKGERPDLAGKAIVPDVPFQAHSAALTLTFYTATSGASAFPKEYVGDGFAVLHGSWNRAFRTGHKVVRVRMKDGKPTGEYVDFMTGMIADDGNAWGRPVGGVVARDGSLLISDDGSNLIYRISYSR